MNLDQVRQIAKKKKKRKSADQMETLSSKNEWTSIFTGYNIDNSIIIQTPLKTGGELRCSGRENSSCSTCDNHHVNLSKVVPYKQTFLCISETWSINSSLSLRSWSHSFSTDCWKLSNSDTRLFNVFICKSCDVDVDSVLVNCRFIITMKIIIIIIAVLKITTKYVTIKPVLIEPLWDWRICSV